jgi:hypothetical protein
MQWDPVCFPRKLGTGTDLKFYRAPPPEWGSLMCVEKRIMWNGGRDGGRCGECGNVIGGGCLVC